MVESLAICQANKGLELFAYCLMPSHLHLIGRVQEDRLSDGLRETPSAGLILRTERRRLWYQSNGGPTFAGPPFLRWYGSVTRNGRGRCCLAAPGTVPVHLARLCATSLSGPVPLLPMAFTRNQVMVADPRPFTKKMALVDTPASCHAASSAGSFPLRWIW